MRRQKPAKGEFLWWLPPPPQAPDYSTPEAITARAQEAAWAGGCPMRAFHHDLRECKWTDHVRILRTIKAALKTDGKVYREFKAALAKAQKGTP